MQNAQTSMCADTGRAWVRAFSEIHPENIGVRMRRAYEENSIRERVEAFELQFMRVRHSRRSGKNGRWVAKSVRQRTDNRPFKDSAGSLVVGLWVSVTWLFPLSNIMRSSRSLSASIRTRTRQWARRHGLNSIDILSEKKTAVYESKSKHEQTSWTTDTVVTKITATEMNNVTYLSK